MSLLQSLKLKKLVLRLILFPFLITSFQASAQEPKKEAPKNAISFNLLGASPYLGITYQRMIIPVLETEIGGGLVGFGGGLKYYPFKNRLQRYNPYIGFIFATADDLIGNTDIFEAKLFYFPIGLNFCGKRGMNFGFDIGPNISPYVIENSPTPAIYTSIKVGYRFGK
ncbi:MAG: hypothetical protein MI810_08195 [Flavobacteriales bacterium]|nr:hypothetical protein [Flavobacteriales bacterium]